MKDGWHIVDGFEVYVENDRIIRGMREDRNGYKVTAYPYRKDTKTGNWYIATGVKVSTFRNSYIYNLF